MHTIKLRGEKNLGWRGHGRGRIGRGLWLGHGPFRNLPPWQRPGWLYSRGSCWWLYPYYTSTARATLAPSATPFTPLIPRFTKEQEIQILKQQLTALQALLDTIKNRLTELAKE